MRTIGAYLPRGNRTTLLQVGSAIITSKLLYAIGLISRGGEATYQILAPTYNQMIRLASGAFATSPITSIMAEAGTLPFELLAIQSTTRIAIRLQETLPANNNLPLIQRASNRIHELTGTAIPPIERRSRRGHREWNASKPNIVWDVKRVVRAGDPPEKVRPIVHQLISCRFNQSCIFYTDGSKCDNKVGAGLFGANVRKTCSLPKLCSVFSAEAYAIRMALLRSNSSDLVILSDSASCLSALEAGNTKHPWIQEIETLTRGRSVQFCWIPGHAGIRGNIEADQLANEARNGPPIDIPVPAEDAVRETKTAIRRYWEQQWFTCRDAKLREIKCDTHAWKDRGDPADQRVLTRLRIGHTRLTHSFLMSKEASPICECCGTTMDVRHIILHCRKYHDDRIECGLDTTSLGSVMNNTEENETKLLRFLRQTDLYQKL